MKRSTRKVLWQKRSKDYAVGVIRQRGKPDVIVVKIRKGSPVELSMDTVPTSRTDEPEESERHYADVYAELKSAMQRAGP